MKILFPCVGFPLDVVFIQDIATPQASTFPHDKTYIAFSMQMFHEARPEIDGYKVT